MFDRRRFLQNSSLLAAGAVVPEFLARTALAAEPGKDRVLIVLELTGGNDGLNTVIPFGDDLYHKARPTLRKSKSQVIAVDDRVGLHPSLGGLNPLLQAKQLAVVQGVGYPNPDRSHFESMDVWHSADPKRQNLSGWLGRAVPLLPDSAGGIPAVQVGAEKLPLALQGSAGGAISLNQKVQYKLDLGDPTREKVRRKLLDDVTKAAPPDESDLLGFVRRRQLDTYATLDKLQQVLKDDGNNNRGDSSLTFKLSLIGKMIKQGFGTRVYYVSLDGFDTHSGQETEHANLLGQVGGAIGQLFTELGDQANRVTLLTFSEFGRRVKENGSKGTDHGAASCLFVAGPGVAGGVVGPHPKLDDLDDGDLKYHTDFRRVYATLLDGWLGCDSTKVLGGKFEHLPLLAKPGVKS